MYTNAYFQVYTAQRIEYSGGLFFGNENSDPTRTLLSFFIASVCGSYEDLICFIPVTTLKSEKLLEHFKTVGQALHDIGFEILPVITDGHRTNTKFFKDLSGGCVTIPIQNPFDDSLPMFLLYDSVHLMKTIFNTLQRRRYFVADLFPFRFKTLNLRTSNFLKKVLG